MWGEWIPTVERMNFLIYTRIAAMAEIGWTNAEQKSFDTFKNALYDYLIHHWNKKGITILPEQLNTPAK